jgi:hypothetical protein
MIQPKASILVQGFQFTEALRGSLCRELSTPNQLKRTEVSTFLVDIIHRFLWELDLLPIIFAEFDLLFSTGLAIIQQADTTPVVGLCVQVRLSAGIPEEQTHIAPPTIFILGRSAESKRKVFGSAHEMTLRAFQRHPHGPFAPNTHALE